MKTDLTKADLCAGLQALGVQRGDALEVHSSLSRLGWVEGGADAVIDALMETVGPEGALIMSAYPVTPPLPLSKEEIARGLTWKVAILPAGSLERTGLGRIVDTFCRRPGTCLGQGLHRVCAWGRQAEEHARLGYRHLVAIDGLTLLIGVGIDRCSSMHLAEGTVGIPPAIRALCEPPEALRQEYLREHYNIGYGGTPEDAWQKVWQRANQQGLVRAGQIGQADCYLFRTRAMLNIYEDWLRLDPFGLYGVQPVNLPDK